MGARVWILDPDSIEFLLLRHWGPPIITVIWGGLIASVLVPRLQAKRDRSRAINERKIALYEDIADQFGRYVSAWRRLMSISMLERDRQLTPMELERKQRFIEERYVTRDALFADFAKARLYFSREACDRIDDFVAWDEANASKRLEDLPDIKSWRRHEGDVIECLGRDLRVL